MEIFWFIAGMCSALTIFSIVIVISLLPEKRDEPEAEKIIRRINRKRRFRRFFTW